MQSLNPTAIELDTVLILVLACLAFAQDGILK